MTINHSPIICIKRHIHCSNHSRYTNPILPKRDFLIFPHATGSFHMITSRSTIRLYFTKGDIYNLGQLYALSNLYRFLVLSGFT